MKKVKKSVGYGYVGTWNDGTLGWNLPTFVCNLPERYIEYPDLRGKHWIGAHDVFVKCKITIEPVISKKTKKLITRKAHRLVK